MVQENPLENKHANAFLINDIDTNGYLINNMEQDYGSNRPYDAYVTQIWDEEGPIDGNTIGKVFDTPDDAYTFYNQYAFTHGFGIHKHWNYKNKVTNEVYRKWMRPCHVKKVINAMNPPYVADVTSKQCFDILSEQRKQYKGKEFYGLIKHFQDKASIDNNQYFNIYSNSDGSPRNVFWADGRSRDAYIKFRDVVMFDVTYLTNKIKFPFDPFVGGESSCGQSESIHSVFDVFVNSNTMLNEFVIQYDNAIKSQRAAEEDEDFKTMNSRAVLSLVHPIEAKAGMERSNQQYDSQYFKKSLEQVTYSVGQVNVEKKYLRTVNFNLLNKVDVTCFCAMFATYGILCKHSLYVMKKRHVETLPDQYILPRWTLDSKYKASNDSIAIKEINNESGVSALTLWCVHSNSTKAIEQAKDLPSEITRLNTILVKFLEDQMSQKWEKEA
uniref:SWIM-type domain-containing protein n=1 Tax=Tanacetum cinerariifolium TaxID=118510 RepID=A0A6L2JRS7_TANCI|nr:hypothetical protein [Tanacetum cinerariifolium]